MVNVFKKRTHLCVVTTSVFFFLQGMGVCTGANSFYEGNDFNVDARNSTNLDVNGGGFTGANITSANIKVKSLDDTQSIRTKTKCIVQKEQGYFCDDGKVHEIKGYTFKISDKDKHAIHVKEEKFLSNGKVSAIGETQVNAQGVTIIGPSLTGSEDIKDGLTSAVFAEGKTKISFIGEKESKKEKESGKEKKTQKSRKGGVDISFFSSGLEAQQGGWIEVSGGMINVFSQGVLVGPNSNVSLKKTTIDVKGPRSLAGLASLGGEITMDSGEIDFVNGMGGFAGENGRIELQEVRIKGVNKEERVAKADQVASNSAKVFKGAGFVLGDSGFINFSDGVMNLTNLNGVWFQNSTYVSGYSPVVEASKGEAVTLSKDISGYSAIAYMKSSYITVKGKDSYGIYFDDSRGNSRNQFLNSGNGIPGEVQLEASSEGSRIAFQNDFGMRKDVVSGKMVTLDETVFEVPQGSVIYADGGHGNVVYKSDVILENKSILAGDLLLESLGKSHVIVSVDKSAIIGAARVDEDSTARFSLSGGSQWILKKSLYRSQQDSKLQSLGDAQEVSRFDCLDSCISYLSLKDSTLKFSASFPRSSDSSKEVLGNVFQTLRIGKGKGKAYQAHGDSAWIQLNAHPKDGRPEDTQMADQILIYGNVSGRTTVHVRDPFVNSQEDRSSLGDGQQEAQKIAQSISIIQVHGEAQKDSFRLNGDYVALGGPYQYVLRAYAPSSYQEKVLDNHSSLRREERRERREEQAVLRSTVLDDNESIRSNKDFWDFRLESKNNSVTVYDTYVTKSDSPVRTFPDKIIDDYAAGYRENDNARIPLLVHDTVDLPATSRESGPVERSLHDSSSHSLSRSLIQSMPTSKAISTPKAASTLKAIPIPDAGSVLTFGQVNGQVKLVATGEAIVLNGMTYPEYIPQDLTKYANCPVRYYQSPNSTFIRYTKLSDGSIVVETSAKPGVIAKQDSEIPENFVTSRTMSDGKSVREMIPLKGGGVRAKYPAGAPGVSGVLARFNKFSLSSDGTLIQTEKSQVSVTAATASGTPTTSASGTPTTSASGTPTTSASGTPITSASGTPTTAASGTPTIAASGTPTTAASTTPTTAASTTPTTATSTTPTTATSTTVVDPSVATSASSPNVTSVAPTASENAVTIKTDTAKVPKVLGPVQRILSAASEQSPAIAFASVARNGVKNTSFNCEANGNRKESSSYLCQDGKQYKIQGRTLKVSDNSEYPLYVTGKNTKVTAEGVTIIGKDLDNKDTANLTQSQLVSAVLADGTAEIILEKKSKVQSSLIGLEAQTHGKIKMDDGDISANYVGVLAGSGGKVYLNNTNVVARGPSAVAGLAGSGGTIAMNAGSIVSTSGVGVRSESEGYVKLNKVNLTAKRSTKVQPDSEDTSERAAFLISNNGSIDFANGNVVTDGNGLWMKNLGDVVKAGASRSRRHADIQSSPVNRNRNHANIESSSVTVEGNKSYGIYFDGSEWRNANEKNQNKTPEQIEVRSLNVPTGNENPTRGTAVVKRSAESSSKQTPIGKEWLVSLKKTDFEVLSGTAVYGQNAHGRVSLENKTSLSGDILLRAENNSNILVSVNNSMITGDVHVDKGSHAQFALSDSSQWFLKKSVHGDRQASESGCLYSCISSVSLSNSSIAFWPVVSGESGYQTLQIGNGQGNVYKADGDAVIYFNAHLDPYDTSNAQMTDRLLIHGDVSGKTVVDVNVVVGGARENNRSDKKTHSVPIIQVYGTAEKDSFQLKDDYIALAGVPYKYVLRSYDPDTTATEEHTKQKFMKDGKKFWNFRLENEYVDSTGSKGIISVSSANTVSLSGSVLHSENTVKAIVPQVPTYLLLPNALFHAGLMDISNQNKQLETMRTASGGMLEVHENPALFLRGYGGSYSYTSNLSALEYGYGGDLDYNGMKAGVLLKTIENTDSAISFGVMGSYGKLSLQPLDVEKSQKSAFDKWSITAYGSMQHDVGFYVDGLLSYGLLKGDVLTLSRGKTATLKGNPLSVSLTGGQSFAAGYEGLVFDPQVQVVYQHLQFDKVRDIDNFDIEMGKLDQWLVRVGGRLTKTHTELEGVRDVSFYGKINLAHSLGNKQTVHFKDAFQLGSFGSSVEAGLGVNIKLLSNFALHGDFIYQHKLSKAGFSGTTFSGGLRYQF
ncbi:autotransporter outer membrane beta-barrel domain-containing protein [Bartonella sp. B35(2025)]